MKQDASIKLPFANRDSPERAGVFQACVEGSSDAIMLTDCGGDILYVNPAWSITYGYTASEAVGQTPRLLRSGHHDKEFYRSMWQEILDPSKGYWKGEVINRTKEGRDIPVLLTISPFRDETGSIRGYMSIAVDISEKKRLEAQILRQDRLASIGLLASGLAHEIGTPLGVVRGRAEYLLSDAEEGSPSKRSLEVIVAQIDRVSKLIYSLLNLARAGAPELVTAVRARPVIDEVASLISPKLAAGQIVLRITVGEDVLVSAESSRLEQVFLNLLMNAIHAVESAVHAGRKRDHRITVSTIDKGELWEIIVADTGCGISSENLGHLFKPFFTTKDVGEGTGLGLAITHQIIQAWGGSIWVDSTEGIGTAFRIRLPKPSVAVDSLRE